MCYVEIDWAIEKHDLCLLADDGKLLSAFTVSNDLTDLQQMQQTLDSLDEMKSIWRANSRGAGLTGRWVTAG